MLLNLTLDQVRDIAGVTMASSTDEARPILCGVRFEPKKLAKNTLLLRVVATDSYRLAITDLTLVNAPGEDPTWMLEDGDDKGFLVHGKGLRDELKAAFKKAKAAIPTQLQTVFIGTDPEFLTVESATDDFTGKVRMIDGSFPKYDKFLDNVWPPSTDKVETNGVSEIFFNPLYLAQMAKMLQPDGFAIRGDKRTEFPVRVIFGEGGGTKSTPSNLKPAWFTQTLQDHSPVGYLLMPVRK